jgi:hypothetical protein
MIVSSPLWAQSASAQTIQKPSVPAFTIETVSFPYDVPPTTTTKIDPYTGEETITTQPGYHVENKTTQIKIRNQPFASYTIQENNYDWTINLFYNIRFKGHFSHAWSYYRLYNGSSDGNLRQTYGSEHTIVPIDTYLPAEGQLDVQIEALEGYEQGIVSFPGAPGTARVITGETSGWSGIQTLTISSGDVTFSEPPPTLSPSTQTPTASPQENPSATPLQPQTHIADFFGIDWWQIAAIAFAAVIVVLVAALIIQSKRYAEGAKQHV